VIDVDKKKLILLILPAVILIFPIVKATTYTSVSCIDNSTLQKNITYIFTYGGITKTLNLSKPVSCANGCDSVTNDCSPSQLMLYLYIGGGILAFMIIIGVIARLHRGR
jgi:hypothetical protein